MELTIKSLNGELGTNYETMQELSLCHLIPEPLIEKYWVLLNINIITNHQPLSDSFLEEHWDELSKGSVSMHQCLSEYILDKYWYELYHLYIFDAQYIPEHLIEKHWGELKYQYKDDIAFNQKLSEDFLNKHIDELPSISRSVSFSQILSEQFIVDNWKLLDIDVLAMKQKLSENIIEKHINELDKKLIGKYQRLSDDFILKHKIPKNNNSWMYKSDEFKKNEILKLNIFECYDDYFIAYIEVKRDRHDRFNQYQFLKDNTYECHAIYVSSYYNSFGFFVSDGLRNKKFIDRFIRLKCKVHYSDISSVIYNRVICSKITILE